MKHLFTTLFLAVLLNGCRTTRQINSSGELFEGTIKFENSIITEKLSDSDQNYYNLFGNLKHMTFAKGNFRSEFPYGQEYERTLYVSQSNKYYMFYRSGEVKYFTCESDSDKIVKINRSSEIVEICGYPCQSIEFDFGRFSMTYFYTKELPIDPNLLKNHQYLHYNSLFKETKSIFLKTIMKYNEMKFISIASEVKRWKVPDVIFLEPTNAIKY